MKSALYLRASTDKQDTSCQQQRDELHAHAQANGLTIVAEYTDDGISGTRSDRPGFQAMMSDAWKPDCPWQAVLVYDRTRWGRFEDLQEPGHWEFHLRSAGKALLFMREAYPNDLPGHIMRLVADHNAKAEREAIMTRMQRGRVYAVQQGYWTQGNPPYGYRLERVREGKQSRYKLRPGPEQEVRVVRWIFSARNQGVPLRDMADLLNVLPECYPPRSNWTPETISSILANPVYKGRLVFNGEKWGGHTVEGRCPAIIEEE